MDRGSSPLEEVKQRRRTTSEVLVFAVLLSLFVNLSASAIFTRFWPSQTGSTFQLILYPALVLLWVAVGFAWITLPEIRETAEIQVLLPLVVSRETAKIRSCPGYSVTRYASLFFNSAVRQNATLRKEFTESWQRGGPFQAGPTRAIARDTLYQLVQRLLLALIDRYGEHTLETASRYHEEYHIFAGKFEPTSLSFDQLPCPLSANIFLAPTGPGGQQQKLRLPRGFLIATRPSASWRDDSHCDLALESRFGSIAFQILPYWIPVREDNRRFKICVKSLGKDVPRDIHLIQIPVSMTICLKGWNLRSKQLDDHYMWMKGLMTEAQKRMDWSEFEKGDVERMVVAIAQGLTELRKSLERFLVQEKGPSRVVGSGGGSADSPRGI